MTDISIPDQNQHDTDKPSRKRSASSNIGIMTLLMTDWEPISSEMIMRLVFAAQATMAREPNLAAHDARLQLAETSMGLAAESSNHDHKYVALGQARRHVARAEQELEYHPPIITGLMADEVMREAVNALLPAAITAALDSASMFYNSPETMAAAIYEGTLEAIETYDLDHGLKPSFWAYMVTTMKVMQLNDRNAAEASASTIAVQQLQRTLKRAASQLYTQKAMEVGSTLLSYYAGKRPADAWSDPRSMREKAQDWTKEHRVKAERTLDIQQRLKSGVITQAEADQELETCGLDPKVAQNLLEQRMRGSRGLVRSMREFGVHGQAAAEVVLTSASLIEQLSRDSQSDVLVSGLDISNQDLINEVLRRAATRGTKIPRELVESVVDFMLSGGGASLSLMNEDGDGVNPSVDRQAAEQAESREPTQRVNRVSRLLEHSAFANLIRQHPTMAVQIVNDRLRHMTSEEESALAHFMLEQDINNLDHPWNVRHGSGWLRRDAMRNPVDTGASDDMINAVVGQRHKRLGGLENMLLPDHRMNGAESDIHYGPKGIDSLPDLQLSDLAASVM